MKVLNRWLNIWFLMLPVLSFFLLFYVPESRADLKRTLVFGVSLDLSGPHRIMSTMQKNGFELWVKHVNARGGILGQDVEIRVLDNQGSLDVLRNHYLEMLSSPDFDLLFCPYSSEHTRHVADLFEKFRVPVLASGASAPGLWDMGLEYLFGLYTPADRYSQGFLEIMSMHHRNRLAIFHSGDLFSLSSALGAESWADRLGMDVVLFEEVQGGYDEYLEAVHRARASGARVLMMFGYFDESIIMRKAIDQAEYRPDAYYATVGPVSSEYYLQLGALGDNTFSTAIWKYHSKLVYPGVHRFNADFIETFNREPNYHAATAYAAGQLMAQALEKIEIVDYQALRDALAAMETFSILGRYGVNYKGRQMRHMPFTTQWQQGTLEIVWPPSLATSSPRLDYGRR